MDLYEKLIADLSQVESLGEQCAKCQREAEKLPALREQSIKLQNGMRDLLKRQDLTSPGNMGWEWRIITFLAEFRKTIISQESNGKSSEARLSGATARLRDELLDAVSAINDMTLPHSIDREIRAKTKRMLDCLKSWPQGES